ARRAGRAGTERPPVRARVSARPRAAPRVGRSVPREDAPDGPRSEEHTSELQSLTNLVCRLLLEKKSRHERVTKTEWVMKDRNREAIDSDQADANGIDRQGELRARDLNTACTLRHVRHFQHQTS